ncbi:MAG: hypothetical protein ACTS4T_00375 [Candidatus Hodgkinia cicadicola]
MRLTAEVNWNDIRHIFTSTADLSSDCNFTNVKVLIKAFEITFKAVTRLITFKSCNNEFRRRIIK